MEQFVICQYDNSYLIGNKGTVKRTNPEIIKRYNTDILKGMIKTDGYKMYWISKKWHYSHRLVGVHFIPNGLNYPEINHKDGNKLNNSVDNLEWVTHSQNHKHRFDVLGHKIPSGQASWLHGREVSSDTRKIMSERKIGANHPRFKGYYIYKGERYESSYALGAAVGRSYKTVLKWCKGNEFGFSFEPI